MRIKILLFLQFGGEALAIDWSCNHNGYTYGYVREGGVDIGRSRQSKGFTISNDMKDGRSIEVAHCPPTIISDEMDELFNTASYDQGEESVATLHLLDRDNHKILHCKFGYRYVHITNDVDWNADSTVSKCNLAKKIILDKKAN